MININQINRHGRLRNDVDFDVLGYSYTDRDKIENLTKLMFIRLEGTMFPGILIMRSTNFSKTSKLLE